MLTIQIILFCLIVVLVMAVIYRYKYNVIYFLPTFLIIFDVLSGWFATGSGFGNLRNIILTLFILYIIIRNKNVVLMNPWIVVFLVYTLFLVPLSSDPRNSIINYLVVFNSLLTFSIAFYLFKNLQQLSELNKFLIIMMFIFNANALLTSQLGIGRNIYGGSFTLGGFVHARLYSGSVFLLLLPIVIPLIKSKTYRIIVFVFSAVLYIFLLLSMRRTSFITPLLGYLVYFTISKNKSRVIISVLTLLIIVIGAFPIYKDVLFDQFLVRKTTLEAGLTTEYRYREIGIVWKETFSNPKAALFGKEIYNSVGNYNEGLWGRRALHTDFAILLHGTGMTGIILYSLILIGILIGYFKYIFWYPKTGFANELNAVFVSLFVCMLFISLQGGLYAPTFRTLIFLYLGAILGIFKNQYQKDKTKSIIQNFTIN